MAMAGTVAEMYRRGGEEEEENEEDEEGPRDEQEDDNEQADDNPLDANEQANDNPLDVNDVDDRGNHAVWLNEVAGEEEEEPIATNLGTADHPLEVGVIPFNSYQFEKIVPKEIPP